MNLFALLIGIDRYSQVPLPDGSYYPHLGGCVRDVDHVEQMLRSRLSLTDDQITKLTSRNSTNGQPVVDAAQLPTYENLVKAFKQVTADAQPGDQVYIHYSGHGGRSATMFEELKGANGLDESLVPCDIGENGVCYLRDIEMAYLLKAMSDKDLLVTLVLDSCHSGGATRGNGGAFPRGITSIDTRKPLEQSAVAGKEELIKNFLELPSNASRSINAASGWRLPTPKNCVIFAACRANELANEYAFDGNERNGALTYWMLDALKQIGAGYTYKMLYNRVVAKVHAKFVDQTPQIEGDSNREIFGGDKLATSAAVNVIKVDLPNKLIHLNTGQAQGIGKGAQFAIYPANTTDFTDLAQRLAVVEIETVGATDSQARIVTDDRASEIQEGTQAVLLGVGIRLRGRVRLVKQKNVFDKAAQDAAIEKLRAVITADDGETAATEKWIRLANDGEEADFQVAVNVHGEYEIWDANGRTLPNLRPALSISDNGAAAQIAQRLLHLTKYRNARLIDNTDPTSPLARKVVAELGKQKKGSDGKTTFEPFGVPARPLSVGEQVFLRVTNLSDTPLNIAIMDLQPDWGISQAFPTPDKEYDLLESGADNALLLPMGAQLPEDYQEGVDVLKIFATVEGTSFHWLEMPALDQPPPANKRNIAGDALEQLMTAFGEPKLTRQMVNLSAPKGRSWATTEVEVRVRRPSIAHVTDPALSLLQSAFDEVISKQSGATKTRSINGRQETVTRPELSNPIISEVTQYCVALAQNKFTEDELNSFDKDALDDAQKRGVVDTVKYCASMAAGMAREWFKTKFGGDDDKYEQYKAALNVKFGDCDVNYKDAMLQYLNYLRSGGHTPYRTYVNLDDFVIDGLPSDAVVGVVADWATGEPEAIEVLRQVKGQNPHVVIHLGDIYYAGTEHEVENYFYQPWKNILDPENSGILSFALPGNHDLYAGGKPFYDLLDKLAVLNGSDKKMASYFCLRNEHWQLIGLDTALHDRLGAGPTYLEESELEWLNDKIQNSGGRRTILLSHHQLFSSNDQFDGKGYNEKLNNQLAPILAQVDLWLWGHEHELVIFGDYMNLKRGRCIGGSAFPVGNFEMPTEHVNPDVPYNKDVELGKGSAFYQHCYTILKLDGANATVSYYEDRDGGRVLFQETL
jgi:predicted phosphodiesterase